MGVAACDGVRDATDDDSLDGIGRSPSSLTSAAPEESESIQKERSSFDMGVMFFSFEKVHMNFERLLSFVCAENPGTRERTIELIINLSYSNPMQVLASLTEIRLLMFRFCAAPGPDWGTVSSLLFVVANAMSIAPDDMQDSICDVIEMSRIVTAAFLRVNESGPFRPDLQRLVKALALVFEIKKVKPSLKILVELEGEMTLH